MKVWIRTQDKKRILNIDNIYLKGQAIKSVNQQYPFGLALGKFKDEEKAKSVLETIFAKMQASQGADCVYDIPEEY